MTTAAPVHPVRDHCLAPSRAGAVSPTYAGKYGRLFPDLEPFTCGEPVLLALGRAGGACDGSAWEARGGDDAAGAAGWPFFGQLVAHDITADRSPLAPHADPETIRNFRTPRANLENLYGAGQAAPFLFDRHDPASFLLGMNDLNRPDDLPRNAQGIALSADPRDDSQLPVSQLHLALLKAHNGIVDRLRRDGVSAADLFEAARRATIWHYQWVILHDFLPRVAGADLVATLLRDGPLAYRPAGEPYIPFEFADAAYRYGHSQIRHRYRVNRHSPHLPVFPDLLGFRPVPAALAVDWAFLFDLPGEPARQQAKLIDGRLAGSLIRLPEAIAGDDGVAAHRSLAVRDLQRGQATGLPSGEAIARRLGETPLTPAETGLAEAGWGGETPLWYYILKEAETRAAGERLGPVGGRIVAEVLLGIVDGDPESFRAVDPAWRPTLPAAGPDFTLGDLLAFATRP